MITRRGLIGGIGVLLAAPAIVRVSSIMPVKAWMEPPKRIVVCAPNTNPISGPWSQYPVAPGARICRGDLVVLGPDGYVRAAAFPVDFHNLTVGMAISDSDGPKAWRYPEGVPA